MEILSAIGIFFGGLGLLLSSFGLFWLVSIYDKKNSTTEKKHND